MMNHWIQRKNNSVKRALFFFSTSLEQGERIKKNESGWGKGGGAEEKEGREEKRERKEGKEETKDSLK